VVHLEIIITDKKACTWERTRSQHGPHKQLLFFKAFTQEMGTKPVIKGPTISKCSSKQLEIIAVKNCQAYFHIKRR
jgi:hypothetical protein